VNRRSTLLESVRGLLERTYRMDLRLADLGPFVIGDEGYRRLYGGERVYRTAGCPAANGAQTLVREADASVRARIYFPDAMIRRLEANPPQNGLCEANVDPFAVFVEEIDHLLLLAERTWQARPVTLFEMELHANVSKYLVLSRFLAGGRPRLDSRQRLWLRHQLFDKGQFRDDDEALRERYRDAAHWAVKFLDRLREQRGTARLRRLRRFHEVGACEKLRLIDARS